jgi:hypothetical protein
MILCAYKNISQKMSLPVVIAMGAALLCCQTREEGIKMATEVISLFSEDEKRFFRLLSEQKYEMDHYSRMMDAEERGIKIGEEREREKARMVLIDEREKAQAVISDKDAVIAGKDAEIARLRALLDKSRVN